MKYSIRKNWINSFELIIRYPVLLLPFMISAFAEGWALEFLYFSPKKPISYLTAPIVRKFFGEDFLHYPADLILLPKMFYYVQLLVYVLLSTFLIAVTVNIFLNIKSKLPLRANAIVKNAVKKYPAFILYGIVVVLLLYLAKRGDAYIFSRLFKLVSNYAPNFARKSSLITLPLFLFFTNIFVVVFLVLTLPIMVIKKKSLIKSLIESIYLGGRHFFGFFILISVPYLIYLPVVLLKGYSLPLTQRTFPEINLYIIGISIIFSMFIDCFVTVCASQWLLDKESGIISK